MKRQDVSFKLNQTPQQKRPPSLADVLAGVLLLTGLWGLTWQCLHPEPLLMALPAGVLTAAGLGAGLFYLSGSKEWEPLVSTALPATGFNGISVALLASSNPIGCIFSAVFISHITVGGGFMTAKLFPSEVSDIISGVVIYLCAFSLLFKGWIMKRFTRKSRIQGKEGNA